MRMLLILGMVSSIAFGEIIKLSTDEEELFLDVLPEETLQDVVERATAVLGEHDCLVLEIARTKTKPWNKQVHSQGKYLGYPRNYEGGISHEERSDIHFIVTTLANKTLINIARSKAELENAGDRIDHVHPFNFLKTIFTHDELKVGIRNIRGKGWVWHSFIAGIKETLTVEAEIGNLKEEYIVDLARAVNLKAEQLRPFIYAYDWDGLIDFLINNVQRNDGGGNRYDM